MKVYDAANIRNVALVGHSGSGKPSSPRPPSSIRAQSTDSAKSTKAPRLPTSTKKKSGASTPCQQASPTPNGTRRKSISSTRRASRTFFRTRARRSASPMPLWSSSTPCRACRSDRKSVERRRRSGPAEARHRQPARSRARQPRAYAEVHSCRAQPDGRSDPAADR